MKAAVITFPGSNCDDDLAYVLKNFAGFEVGRLWHKDTPDLSVYDLVAVPGGFSYGDYLRCGAMAARSPIMEKVKNYAGQGGLLIGICNGFQILCEANLLPGALTGNTGQGFLCQDITLKVKTNASPWTQDLKQEEVLSLPIAHGEGRYIIGESNYKEMCANGQILLTYTETPNGSLYDIAGICNTEKNIFGLMPHPERATDLRSKDGLKIWNSLTRYIREKKA